MFTRQVPPGSPARVRVALPASLTAPEPAEEVGCEAATVRELLAAVAAARPGLAGRLLYEGRPLVTVAVNGTVLPAQTAMARALADGDRVELVPPVAGG
ncbi:MAG TPA: MoaD/ThiS family protein [Thermoleophilia bacterium]|nr:MoaD/ThiS family protein [Thermoleophilia bacterium]